MKNTIKILSGIFLFTALMALSGCDKKDPSSDLKKKIDTYVGYWNTANFQGIEDFLCADFELIESPEFEAKKGIDKLKQTILDIHAAYPDFHITINELICDKNKMAGIWTITATNTGQGTRPPTGKHLNVKGISVFHFRDGKLKDEWVSENEYYWLKQLGYTLVPPKTDSEK
jgi:predicted ester cyclase